MPVNSKRKGTAFEREVVRLFRPLYPEARRGWWQSGEQSRGARGGAAVARVPDVQVPGLWVECGTGRQMDGRAKLEQAVHDEEVCRAERHEVRRSPVAVTRRLRSRRVEATVRLRDLLLLVPATVELDDVPGVLDLEDLLRLLGATRASGGLVGAGGAGGRGDPDAGPVLGPI